MRRTPISDRPDDAHDEDATTGGVRRVSTAPSEQRSAPRRDLVYWQGGRWQQRPVRRRSAGPLAWLLRGIVGIAALAGIWLGLQALFPSSSPRPVDPSPAVDAPAPSAVGAPDPPAATAPPRPPATPVAQPTSPPVGDRLPGLAPAPAASTGGATAAAPQPAPTVAPPREEPTQVAEPTPDAPPGTPTIAPIPAAEAPPTAEVAPSAPQPASAPAAARAPAPPRAAAAPAPAPPVARASGPLQMRASVSPANPVSEQAMVTASIAVTHNGAPVSGASCLATIAFRTATVRQPPGGAVTGPNGTASFVIDAKGATYNRYVPVGITCSTRFGTVSATTGFTPVRGR